MTIMKSYERLYHVGVKALVFNQHNELLILKRAGKNFWDLPGGRLQADEQPLQTLKRELFEETGIEDIHEIMPIEIVMTPISIKLEEDKEAGLLLWYHACKIDAVPNIILSEEHTEYAWAPWSDVQQRDAFFGARLAMIASYLGSN